jgi:hypothetical protein
MHTPYFPIWRRKLAALGQRKVSLGRQSPVQIQSQCSRFLSRNVLGAPNSGAGSRRRVFDRTRTFWLFIWQVLQPGTACRAVVRQVQAFCESNRVRVDENSSAYCQARLRLPLECMQQALRQSARAADSILDSGTPGWSRPVKVVDATSVQLPDTDENRAVYPYPAGPQPGCGFPVMSVLAIQSLGSGAILETVQAPWSVHDARMFRSIWPSLQTGDIILGDRAFGSYAAIALLPQRGVDMVCRLNQCRTIDLHRAERIGPNDWLLTWNRPGHRHKTSILTPEEWAEMPAEITVRLIHVRISANGFRTREVWISTTLLDPIAYPADAIAALYLRRWEMEMGFRDLKTTMGMERLRCLTPHMVHKELLAYLIAHNFMRCLIAQVAAIHHLPRTRISFKGTLDAARSFHQAMSLDRGAARLHRLHSRLLEVIALDAVPYRPNRSEPRAVKTRPKNYQRLNKPRHLFREAPTHRSRHKSNPSSLS